MFGTDTGNGNTMNHKAGFLALAVICVCASAFAMQDPAPKKETPQDELSKLLPKEAIEKCGFQKLTKAERDAVAELWISSVQRAMQLPRPKSPAERGAESYMRNQGFDLVTLAMTSVQGQDFLVARNGFSQYVTKDIPFGLNSILFQAGDYWAKTLIFGGVSEFIDDDGHTHSFFLAEWKSL